MTGIIFDIKKFALHDGPGIRTTVFFKGCPLNCLWCHNPESRNSVPEEVTLRNNNSCKKKKMIGTHVSIESLFAEICKDEIFYNESDGGVTFSGGEPLLQINFLNEILSVCKSHNLHTTVDTSGYVEWESFQKVLSFVDLFLFDLKLCDDKMHQQYVSVSNKVIKKNLLQLLKTNANVKVRLPLIAEITDTEKNISDTISFLKNHTEITEIDLLPYNKFGEDKIERYQLDRVKMSLESQNETKLDSISDQFKAHGIVAHIGG